jgi:hypothetical protein
MVDGSNESVMQDAAGTRWRRSVSEDLELRFLAKRRVAGGVRRRRWCRRMCAGRGRSRPCSNSLASLRKTATARLLRALANEDGDAPTCCVVAETLRCRVTWSGAAELEVEKSQALT